MQIHDLKCWPKFFMEILVGNKLHDLRRADRDYKIGDCLKLQEFDPVTGEYTGKEQMVFVTYITSSTNRCALSDEGLHPDFCILSISKL